MGVFQLDKICQLPYSLCSQGDNRSIFVGPGNKKLQFSAIVVHDLRYLMCSLHTKLFVRREREREKEGLLL